MATTYDIEYTENPKNTGVCFYCNKEIIQCSAWNHITEDYVWIHLNTKDDHCFPAIEYLSACPSPWIITSNLQAIVDQFGITADTNSAVTLEEYPDIEDSFDEDISLENTVSPENTENTDIENTYTELKTFYYVVKIKASDTIEADVLMEEHLHCEDDDGLTFHYPIYWTELNNAEALIDTED